MSDIYHSEEWYALINKIRSEPHNKLHRLVAADFLEEHDELQYAQFIRAQVENRTPPVNKLSKKLLRKWFAPWFGPQQPRLDVRRVATRLSITAAPATNSNFRQRVSLHVTQGFVCEAIGPIQHVLDHGAELLKQQPLAASRPANWLHISDLDYERTIINDNNNNAYLVCSYYDAEHPLSRSHTNGVVPHIVFKHIANTTSGYAVNFTDPDRARRELARAAIRASEDLLKSKLESKE